MTTLIPKIDFKNGGSTPVGAVNRTINQKLEETVSVGDFGAVGDGTTDDTTAIQNALNASSVLNFVAGKTYKITSVLTKTGDIIINGNNAVFNVTGDINGFSFSSGNVIFNNIVITRNGSPQTSTLAAIVTTNPISTYFSNVNVAYFHIGFNFATTTALTLVQDCSAQQCTTGFQNTSTPGSATTTVFDRCYALSCGTGYYLYNVTDGEFRNCAVDIGSLSYTVTNTNAFTLSSCGSINFYVSHIEGNPYAGNFTCYSFTNTDSVNIIGDDIDIYQNSNTTTLFSVYNTSHVNILGCRQTTYATQPTTIRYQMITDNVANTNYLYSFNNKFVDTNCTIRQGNSGSGNVGVSWVTENNTPNSTNPNAYKLTGTNNGVATNTFAPGDGTPIWTSGSGSPNGVVTAVVGSMFTRTDGGTSTTLYVKESGSGNTGWVAK